MDKTTYEAMIADLKEQRNAVLATLATDKQVILETEKKVKDSEQELVELDQGIQFIVKRFLQGMSPASAEEVGDESKYILSPSIIEDDANLSQLDKAVLLVLRNHSGEKMKARIVAEILQKEKYPTTAADFYTFTTIVGNTLRTLERRGYVGLEKTGRFVKYYSKEKAE